MTEGSDYSPSSRSTCLYHLPDTVTLSPLLPLSLSTKRAGRSQIGWWWESQEALRTQHLQGSWRTTRSAVGRPGSRHLSPPRLCPRPGGLREAALLTLVLPGGRGRPRGKRAPAPLGAQAGAPRALPRGSAPPAGSRGCGRGARGQARSGRRAPRLRRPLPGRPLLGAPSPRTPARRSAP